MQGATDDNGSTNEDNCCRKLSKKQKSCEDRKHEFYIPERGQRRGVCGSKGSEDAYLNQISACSQEQKPEELCEGRHLPYIESGNKCHKGGAEGKVKKKGEGALLQYHFFIEHIGYSKKEGRSHRYKDNEIKVCGSRLYHDKDSSKS